MKDGRSSSRSFAGTIPNELQSRSSLRIVAVLVLGISRRGHSGVSQRNAQKYPEFFGQVAADPGVDLALFIVEPGPVRQREDAFVPDVRVDVEATTAVNVERDKVIQLHVVAGKCQWSDERRSIEREEQLAAVGVVVGVPQDHPLSRPGGRCGGEARIGRPSQDVLMFHRVVPATQDLALPPEFEGAGCRPPSLPVPGSIGRHPDEGQVTISSSNDSGSETSVPYPSRFSAVAATRGTSNHGRASGTSGCR